MKHSCLLLIIGVIFVAATLLVNIIFMSLTYNESNDINETLAQFFSVPKPPRSSSRKKKNNRSASYMETNNDAPEKQLLIEKYGKEKVMRRNKNIIKRTQNRERAWKGRTEPKAVEAKEEKDNTVGGYKNETIEQIHLVLPPNEIEWIRKRNQLYHEVYNTHEAGDLRRKLDAKAARDPERFDYNETTGFTKYQMDKEGPWLDFLIAGHPKTGTTTLVANLANIAPMKVKDFCVATMPTLLSYINIKWPKQYPEIQDQPDKYIPDRKLQMRGAKCPRFLADASQLLGYGYAYPRTKLIIGMRHPVLWFTSFINMGNVGDLYSRMKICPHYHNIDPITGIPTDVRKDDGEAKSEICLGECRCGIPVCFHRARLHLPLARVGKTPLFSKEERDLLSPGDPDGGENLFNGKLRNPIFVYEQTQMKEDTYWDEVAGFLGLSHIPNAHYKSAHGKGHNKTLCIEYYDEFRAQMMAHSYNVSVWLEEYFLPVGLDPNRPDVVIANPESFRTIIETYKHDPCKRLIRRESDGEYILDPGLGEVQDDGVTPAVLVKYSTKVKACRASYPLTPEEAALRKAQIEKRNEAKKRATLKI
mmetsp:Transcript_19803/g.42966  ORF Transcript_19803/g.42966 Transcript_19803/m.42966 type:complete len:588 (-) Transcript_19803:2731-4494(-)|eukprot:CAMPEP_0168182496 /NCGR_PEP_ID=MMETSP0139_2-20121125/11926_1 /TAXON_ID=44445 /ORGANISM="Pseudo-nitzschia australis, Strain 10249 10 AB" /LENGTH=587 /DNA_ID=CAMNT_0008103433 /DNA_START=208 /DNA_END=1971 /DNA_ORIENTATION=-